MHAGWRQDYYYVILLRMNDGPSLFRKHHAARLRELRVNSGITQHELALKVARHRTWVLKAESGESNLSIDTVALIRAALIPAEASKPSLRARVGAKLASVRNAKTPRISQETLSMMAGCNLKYIAELEQGRVATSLDQLGKVIDFLGLDYDEIFD